MAEQLKGWFSSEELHQINERTKELMAKRDNDRLNTMTGVKHDTGKVALDLIDPLAIEGLAAVLGFGAQKYAAHNWRGGFKYSRLIAALLRHTFAILRGE